MVKLNGHIAPRVACVRPSPTAAVSDKLRALRAVGLYVNVTQRLDKSIPCDLDCQTLEQVRVMSALNPGS